MNIQALLKNTLRASLALVPLIVTPWTLYPFVFGKMLFIHAMTIIMLALAAPLWWEATWRRKMVPICKEPLTLAWVAMVALLAISSVVGGDFSRSWWGTQERGIGLILFLELTVWLILLRATHESVRDKRITTRVLVASGLITSALAFLRLGGVLLFGVDTGLRLSGTIANPIFFAGSLIFFLYFAWYGFMYDTVRYAKWIYAAAMLVFAIAILSTQTRSIVLAAFAAAGVGIVMVAFAHTRLRPYVIAASVAMALLIGVVVMNRDFIVKEKIPLLGRVVGTTINDASLRTRVAAWKSGLNAWKEKPVFGWGIEQFTPAFDAHYPPELLRYGLSATRFDRAHNIVVEQLVMGGLVGLLAYFALFAVPLFILYQRKTISSPFGIATVMVMVAHHTHLMFAFDTPVTYPLVAVFLVWTVTHGRERDDDVVVEWSARHTASLAAATALALWLIGAYVIRPMNASSAMLHVLLEAHEGSRIVAHEQCINLLNAKTPYPAETRIECVRNVIQGISEGVLPIDDIERYIEQARRAGDQNIADHPKDSFPVYLNGVLMYHAATVNPAYFEAAHDYFDRAIAISPRQQYLYVKAELLQKQGKLEDALAIYEQALALSDEVPLSKWYVGLMLNEVGRKDEGVAMIFEAIDQGYVPTEIENFTLLARLLHEHKRSHDAANYYAFAVEADALNPQKWAEFAVYLSFADAPYSAARAARMAAMFDASFENEAAQFIEGLGDLPETDEFFEARLEQMIDETREKMNR